MKMVPHFAFQKIVKLHINDVENMGDKYQPQYSQNETVRC